MRLSNPRNRSQWNIVKFNKEGSVFFFFFLIPLPMMQSGVLRKLQLASTFISLTRIMIEWILQSNLWNSSKCLGPINVYIKETDNELKVGTQVHEQHCKTSERKVSQRFLERVASFNVVNGIVKVVQSLLFSLKSCDPKDEGKTGACNKIYFVKGYLASSNCYIHILHFFF